MPLSTTDIFAPGGPIARAFGDDFEPRKQQLDMAHAIERALDSKSKLLVEAGTGVGKSFAYLVPAIARIIAKNEKIVIATNTISLQEQLLLKDIPLMERIFAPAESTEDAPPFRAELVKGRGNYLSIRRLQLASERQDKLFFDEASRRSLHLIEDWAYITEDGTLSTLPQLERPGIWDKVQSDSGNCMGRKCPTYEKCFYQSARKRMERANLLICNHALFFSDLALRIKGVGFLPRYDHVILDEAHNIEDVASDHFGISLSEGRVKHLINSLLHGKRHRGFLATLRSTDEDLLARAANLVQNADHAASFFFEQFCRLTKNAPGTARIYDPDIIENPVTPAFRDVALVLRRLKETAPREEDKYELNSYVERATEIALEAEMLIEQQLDGCAYWVEVSHHEGRALRATFACSPIDVGPLLRAHLFTGETSVILTSATLTTSRASFEHTKSRLGCEDADTLHLGSPFDHASQVELHLDRAMPEPNLKDYLPRLAEQVPHHIRATDGGAFVLFTSFDTMYKLADSLRAPLEESGNPFFVQGRDGSRQHILQQFRNDERSILFGTSSFWQGVDVRGRALRNVIITRLPFDPPDRPLTEARNQLIASRGGNPFMDDSLPRAVIRFKQGFGRLIRSAADTGRVVVLDPRILTKFYGKAFLQALPEGVRIYSGGEELAAVVQEP